MSLATRFMSTFLFSLFLTSRLFFCGASSSYSDDNLIANMCSNCSEADPNIDYEFCLASFESYPCSHHAKNLTELGRISIDGLLENVTGTSNYVNEMLENDSLDPYVKQCLEDCSGLYSDSIPTLTDVAEAFDEGRYKDVNIGLSSVMDASSTCEEGFAEKEGTLSPMEKRNDDVFRLCAISLSIVSMLAS